MTPAYRQAVENLLVEFADNPWFVHSYWPENEPRVRQVVKLVTSCYPTSYGNGVLEIGCGNGYIAYLFSQLGYCVDGCDVYKDERRTDLFKRADIGYNRVNLNDVEPLAEWFDADYEIVLLGEVFEHILNNPAGLLRNIHRILKPSGLLVLTTPNPSTLANAVRVLRDQYILWGTDEFLRSVKLDAGKVIDAGGIHYREYPAWMIQNLLREVGFDVRECGYVPTGIGRGQSWWKRWGKRVVNSSGLGYSRLFATNYVIGAVKP